MFVFVGTFMVLFSSSRSDNKHAARLTRAHTHTLGCKRQTPLESTGILFWIDGFTFIWDFIRLWSEIFMAVCVCF